MTPGRPIRLLTLVQKAPGIAPNQRFRHEQWAPILAAKHDIHLEFDAFESPGFTRLVYQAGHRLQKAHAVLRDALARWKRRWRALEYDGVLVVREAMLVGPPWIERFLARQGTPFVYDLDDAVWVRNGSLREMPVTVVRAPWKTKEICRLASAVTVGNTYLGAYAGRYNTNVHIVRTSIDTSRHHFFEPPTDDDAFTIVWTGSHSTLAHLEVVRAPLERFGAMRRVRLRVICNQPPPPLSHVELDFVPWDPTVEAEALAAGHVGIMPLPDSPFTRGKCGAKALQYLAIGRPAIVSPIGINREIVVPEHNGFWAESADDWVRALTRLADDPALRARMGAAGRETVLAGFTADQSAEQLAGVVRGVVGHTPRLPGSEATARE